MAPVCRQASVRLRAERDHGLRSYDRAQHRQRLNALVAREEATRTVAVNTLVVYQMFYLFHCRRLRDPVYGIEGKFGNRYVLMAIAVIVLRLLFTYAPSFQGMFQTRNIGIEEWGLILMVTFPVFFLMETEEWVLRRLQGTSKQD